MKYFVLIICYFLLFLFKQGIASNSHTPETRQDGLSVEIAGRCYFFARFDAVNYENAKSNCKTTVGMVLASFETKEENDAVMEVISQRPDLDFWMWTSGVRTAGSDVWSWDSVGGTTEIAYSAWMEGSPNAITEDPACLNFSYTSEGWDDDACNLKMSYLCEEESEVPVGCQ